MKSVKKRFKMKLLVIEQSAMELEMLCADVGLLESMSALVRRVLQLCEGLNLRMDELKKNDFVEQIRQDETLFELDEITDRDVISELEQRFSEVLPDGTEARIGEFMRQFLEKLEKQHATLLKNIRDLGVLLTAAD